MKKLYILFILITSVFFLNIVKAESLIEYENTYEYGLSIGNYKDILIIKDNYYMLDTTSESGTELIIPKDEFKDKASKSFPDLYNASFIKYNNNIILIGTEKNALKIYVVDENLQITNQKETSILIDLNATIKTYLYDNKVYLMLFENETMQKSTIYEIDSELNITENNLSSYDSELLKKVLKGDYYIIRMNDIEKDNRITHYYDTAYNKDFSVLIGETSNITYDEINGNDNKARLTILDATGTEILNNENEEYMFYLDVEIIKNKILVLASNFGDEAILVYDSTGKLKEKIILPESHEEKHVNYYSMKKAGNKLILYSTELVKNTYQQKFFSIYNFDLSIIANESLYGTIEVVDTALANTEVSMSITPNTGYEIDTIEIIDSLGNIIPSIDNKFIMPEDDIYITVNYKAIIDNPETADIILIVAISTLIVTIGMIVLSRKLKWLK